MSAQTAPRVEADPGAPIRMKAIVCRRYGTPEALHIEEVEKPAPTEGQVLVKVLASSVNAKEWHRTHGALLLRLFTGLRRPKDPWLGTDIAGRVEAVGTGVTRFKPGDEVFGAAPAAFAEYAVAREDRIVPKPANVSFEQAGAVGVAAITALQGLRDHGHIKAGQKVLINGASGGVGTFAVQIAKAYGAEVTAVCSPRNLEQAQALGADSVIDYTKEDFTQGGRRYDLIFDVVGNHSGSAYRRTLKSGGICIIVGFGFPHVSWGKVLGFLVLGPIRSRMGATRARFMGGAKFSKESLAVIGELLASSKIVPMIDRRYSLPEAAEALQYLGEGHARGKVVITMNHDNGAQETSHRAVLGTQIRETTRSVKMPQFESTRLRTREPPRVVPTRSRAQDRTRHTEGEGGARRRWYYRAARWLLGRGRHEGIRARWSGRGGARNRADSGTIRPGE